MCSGMVCTLASVRISANLSKSGEVSVVVTVWVWSHMPIHNLKRHSNTSYMLDMWTWDAVWKVLQPQSIGMVCNLASGRILATLSTSWEASMVVTVWDFSHHSKSGEASVVVMVWVWKPYAHPQPEKVLKPLIYICINMGRSLKDSTDSIEA